MIWILAASMIVVIGIVAVILLPPLFGDRQPQSEYELAVNTYGDYAGEVETHNPETEAADYVSGVIICERDMAVNAVKEFLLQFPMISSDFFNSIYSVEISEGQQIFFNIPTIHGQELDDGRFSIGWEYDEHGRWQEIITTRRQFQLGWVGGEAIEYNWGNWVPWEPILTYEVPEVYIRRFRDSWERTGFYDRYGNRITGVDWIFYDHLYATGFSLWDFDNSGIPWILVEYWGNYEGSGDGGTPTSLFRFIDGEFRRVSQELRWGDRITYSWPSGFEPEYFFDTDGRLVMSTSGVDAIWYDHITFNGATAIFSSIAMSGFYWDGDEYRSGWRNYITGETNIPGRDTWRDRDPDTPRYIPGMEGIPLTRIEPLAELQVSVTAYIRQRTQRGYTGAAGTPDAQDVPATADAQPPVDGRQVAEEFLMRFPSIFMDRMPTTGWGLEEGRFYIGSEMINGEWRQIVSYEVPDIYFCNLTWGYYDRYGNRIAYDVPWLVRGRHAFGFRLFDFDNSGIPDILILSSTGEHEWYGYLPHTLYRFIDGAYRRIYTSDRGERTSFFPYSDFFFDPEGNLIGNTYIPMPAMGGMPAVFYRVEFDGYWASFTPLYRQRNVIYNYNYAVTVWKNYVTGEDYIAVDDPEVARWRDALTPVPRLTALEDAITDSILWRRSVG